jgi:hypothetical protein
MSAVWLRGYECWNGGRRDQTSHHLIDIPQVRCTERSNVGVITVSVAIQDLEVVDGDHGNPADEREA